MNCEFLLLRFDANRYFDNSVSMIIKNDVPVVELNQHDDVPVIPELVLVDEDEDPEEDKFEEEEDPQEEEDDMEVDIEEDENEPELTYPYEEVDPLNPSPPASESKPEDAIEVENPIKHEDETVPASIHKVGKLSTAPFLREDNDGLLHGLMRRDINSLFGRMASRSRRLYGRETAHALEEAMKGENVEAENLGRLIKPIFKFRPDGMRYFGNRVWLPLFDGLRDLVMHESYKSKYSIHPGWTSLEVGKDYYGFCERTAENAEWLIVTRRAKPLEFEVGDMILLKVSPWKGVVRFGKRRKLNPRYIGPFKILTRVSLVAYTLELPEKLKGIHSTFHVLNIKRCLAEGDVVVPMDEIQLDDKLHMIEEPVEVVDREVKRLKQSQIPIVKVRWNSQRGQEFTWEREDQIIKKYPHLFISKDEARKADKSS
nr:putative reverse transcriptase domain-containing protein [Tanacetum cinerariifolium]